MPRINSRRFVSATAAGATGVAAAITAVRGAPRLLRRMVLRAGLCLLALVRGARC